MHYYTRAAESCHEVVGKNGKVRPTRITDARERGLVPSVTTIMDVQSKPALIQWLQNQILEAAMASPFNAEEWFEEGWKKYIKAKSREIGEKAAKRGNEIHDMMESLYRNGTCVCSEEDLVIVNAASKVIYETFPTFKAWIPEASFAHTKGFGGRVDLYGHDSRGNYIIIDFKTKDKTDVKDMVQYDDHCIQLAAYQVGLDLPATTRRFNLFISTNAATPGLCVLRECTKFDKYIKIFNALLELWKAKNSYNSEFVI